MSLSELALVVSLWAIWLLGLIVLLQGTVELPSSRHRRREPVRPSPRQ